jgi:hypothetical protein
MEQQTTIKASENDAEITIVLPDGNRLIVYIMDGAVTIASPKNRLTLELVAGNRVNISIVE